MKKSRLVLAVVLMSIGFGAVFVCTMFIVRYNKLSDFVAYKIVQLDQAQAAGDQVDIALFSDLVSETHATLEVLRILIVILSVVALASLIPGSILSYALYRQTKRRNRPRVLRLDPDAAGAIKGSSDVFVSYAREDQEFVRVLVRKLSAQGRETWIDWQGLPPTVDWMQEIHRAIEGANTFVFVISPDSLSSKVCQAEFEYAANLDKRIVPVVHRDPPSGMVTPEIAARNWVFFRRGDDPDVAFEALNRALDVDIGWLRFHTRLLIRAKEWSAHDADDSYLLAGTDLDEAQNWLGRATQRQPRVNSLQTAYVAASAHGNVVRQRRQVRGFYVASLAFGLLQPGITYAFAFEEISESGLVVLAPLWILALAFGGSGLLTPRPTLMKSAMVATGVAVLMIVFYQTVWPVL